MTEYADEKTQEITQMARITEAEKVYTQLTALTASGTTFADGVRKVAAGTGKKEGAIRANYYNHKKKLDGASPAVTGRRGRPKAEALTVDEALAQARAILEQAVNGIDAEVQAAKDELDGAKARYDVLTTSVKGRKAELQKKINALVS
jgi:outer membrane murein-binding lipoprotein Lpp